MMKNLLKKISLFFAVLITSTSFAQNWQYVGPQNINNSIGFSTYLYFADLEINAAGDAFLGYWANAGTVNFAKYTSGSWTQLPSIGTFTANAVDVEVSGSNYYIAYSRVKSGNMYAYVQKYNGSGWTQIGDSLLLGNSGSGGYFDFLLDNAGVPTLLGAVNTVILSDKKMMQYNGTNWTTIHTFTNSAATIFRENAGVFNSTNSLYCATQGYLNGPLRYYTVINKLTAGVRSTAGDTIWRQLANHKLKVDGTDVPYWCCNATVTPKILAYKLSGSLWSFAGDTTSATVGNMLCADLTSNGKVVFNSQFTNLYKSAFYYSSNTRSMMDTINISNTSLLSVSDMVVAPGSGDVYIATLELKPSFAQDLSVMKHSAPGVIGIKELNSLNESILVYPNPSHGHFILNQKTLKGEALVKIYNFNGQIIHQEKLTNEQQVFDLGDQAKGIYLIKIYGAEGVYTCKIAIE